MSRLAAELRNLAAGDLTDADAVRRFAADRDPAAFEVLVWRHGPMVAAVCRRVLRHAADSDDAFQAAFLALVRCAGRIADPAAVAAWLHRVALHVALKAKARRRPHHPVPDDVAVRTDPAEVAEWREAVAALDEEVNRLPARYRAAVVLCELEGLSHADAARELGCPKGTVDSRVHWAKRRLRDRLARRGVTVAGAVVAVPLAPAVVRAAVRTATEPVSGPIHELANEGVRVMTHDSAYAVVGKVVAAAVLVAAVGWGIAAAGSNPPAAPAPAVALVPIPAPDPNAPPPDIALLLIEDVTGRTGTVDVRRLVRVGFKDGKMRPPETVWEDDQQFFGHFGGHRVVGRQVVTAQGRVIDVPTKRVTEPEKDGRDDDERDRGLRGARSPDGTKAVQSDIGDELVLHRVGQPPKSLGRGFVVEYSVYSSTFGNPPVLWLDDDRILTQVRNGELVAVKLDGTRTPVVKFPASKELVAAPRLLRDPGGRVIYECGGEGFVVDVKAGTWKRAEWVDLGHGFEASWVADGSGHLLRHNGKDIGRVWCWPRWPGRTATADGYLAAVASIGDGPPVSSGPGHEEVRVWTAKTGAWSTVKLMPNSLVGWMK